MRGSGPVRGPGKVLQEENSRTALTVTSCNEKESRKVPQFLAAFTGKRQMAWLSTVAVHYGCPAAWVVGNAISTVNAT